MAPRRDHPDLLIVGGGPAGGSAAITAASRGLRVVLLERDGTATERPGESLHPGIEPLLGQFGLAGRLGTVVGARHPGVWITWNGSARFEPFGSDAGGAWRGFQVRRTALHGLLLARAAELGAEIRQPARVTGANRSPDGFWDVETDAGGLRCRMLVDASGDARWLDRRLSGPLTPRSPRLLARFGHAEGSCPARDEAPALESLPDGWLWTARVGPDRYAWVRLAVGSEPGRETPAAFAALRPSGPSRGADVTWHLAERPAGPGWFLVGDAAARLDPLSSHGVLKAIMSGMMAAHFAAAILQEGAAPEAAEAQYRSWLHGWFEADAERLAGFYRQLGLAEFGPLGSTLSVTPELV